MQNWKVRDVDSVLFIKPGLYACKPNQVKITVDHSMWNLDIYFLNCNIAWKAAACKDLIPHPINSFWIKSLSFMVAVPHSKMKWSIENKAVKLWCLYIMSSVGRSTFYLTSGYWAPQVNCAIIFKSLWKNILD